MNTDRQAGWSPGALAVVEIYSTLNRWTTIYRRFRRSCSANFELLVRSTLNYSRFGSRNSELSGSAAPQAQHAMLPALGLRIKGCRHPAAPSESSLGSPGFHHRVR